jgi:DnaJ-domain-containing protein 1
MPRLLTFIFFIIIGYFIFRYITKLVKEMALRKGPGNKDQSRFRDYGDTEDDYRQILGITNIDSAADIRKRYKELLAQYHPDKVQHLGVEFQEMAEKKTRAIMEAYEFFRKKYNL